MNLSISVDISRFLKDITKFISILDLRQADVELDERVTALEENGGGGDSQNGKLNINLGTSIYLYPKYLPMKLLHQKSRISFSAFDNAVWYLVQIRK